MQHRRAALPRDAEVAVRGDWFITGDLARIDDEGYLYIVDRKNDMIISGGENVYPREVEEVLLAHAAVRECAVVGAPHGYWGEVITAFVAVRAGMRVTPPELEAACRAQLARYKIPKDFRMVDAVPRNSMGKIMRRALRDQLAA